MNLFNFVRPIKISSMKKYLLLFFTVFCFNFAALYAQSPCSSIAHQQFDFWLGDWEVYHAQADTIVGHNTIEKVLNGCVVMENWIGATGFAGKSINTYNPIDSTWNQVWVDVSGATYHFKGRLAGNSIKMKGTTTRGNGQAILFEMNYTLDKITGNVRQVWNQSSDDGDSWTAIFDGIYKKKVTNQKNRD